MSRLKFFQFLSIYIVFSVGFTQAVSAATKVLIFYSSMGMGHIAATRNIEKNLREKDPNVEVIQKDIRDFMKPIHEKLDRFAFWYLVKNYPDLYDYFFKSTMTKGRAISSLDRWPKDYAEADLLAYIRSVNPDHIVSTHYGTTISLGNLREHGDLTETPISWFYTEFLEGFFPRISKRVDMTFLPMIDLEQVWIDAGVPKSKIIVSGTPLNPKIWEPVERKSFLEAKGVDPNLPVIVLSSGYEGVGDFPVIVKSLAEKIVGPVQIIANCGRNAKHVSDLAGLQSEMPEGKTLFVYGLLPQEELLNLIKSSDLYITKSAGSAPEGFAIQKPMILLDVYGGHERANTEMFVRQKLALATSHENEVGDLAKRIMADPKLRDDMRRAQEKYRESFQGSRITDYLLEKRKPEFIQNPVLGIEGGQEIAGVDAALENLEKDSPADIEILMSYAIGRGSYFDVQKGNPFGHIAIRINDWVYTVNGLVDPKHDQRFFKKVSLHDYLYGVNKESRTEELVSTHGIAYGRDVISLRIRGVSAEQRARMLEEIAEIEADWRAGKVEWKKSGPNCVDYTEKILFSAGIGHEPSARTYFTLRMPLTSFERYYRDLQSDPSLALELISYPKVVGSQNEFGFTAFPISLHEYLRAFRHLRSPKFDSLEARVTKRVVAYPGTGFVEYENIDGYSTEENQRNLEEDIGELDRLKANALEAFYSAEFSRVDKRRAGFITSALYRTLQAASKDAEIDQRLGLRDVMGHIADSHNDLDQYYRTEADYLIRQQYVRVNQLKIALSAQLTDSNYRKLGQIFNRSEKVYEDYLENRMLYGQAKDHLRVASFRAFFDSLFDLSNELDRLASPENSATRWGRVAAKLIPKPLKDLATNWTWVSRTGFLGARLLISLWTQAKSPPGKTPVMNLTTKIIRRVGDLKGIRVEVAGRENIPNLEAKGALGEKTINVFVATHRSEQLDGFLIAHLNLGPVLLFGATDHLGGIPPIIRNQIANVDSIITVGRGSDKPIEMAIQRLNEGKAKSIFICPEATTSTLFETRPLREKFSWGLLQSLNKAGYKLNIIPITFVNAALFMGRGELHEGIELRAVIHPAIDQKMIDALRAVGGDVAVNQFIREVWIQELERSDPSRPTLTKIESKLNSLTRGMAERKQALKREEEVVNPKSAGCPTSLRSLSRQIR